MSVGGVSKTAFHQMLPAFPIESGSLGVGLSTRSIQEVLIAMAFNAAARFGTGAELPQSATQTDRLEPGGANRDFAAIQG
jgi:hypothetical protein